MTNTFVAIDLETTGLSPDQDKIIEIGAVKVVDGRITAEFSRLVNPHIVLPEKVIELTGIQEEMLVYQPEEDMVIPELLDFLGNDIIIGHNILFDYSFLKAYAAKRKLIFEKKGIDTLYLSRMLHEDVRSRSLENMCSYYNIDMPIAHRALQDAHSACSLYFKLYDKFGEEKSELFEPKSLIFKPKKYQTITKKQKNYLLDLLKYHKINTRSVLNDLSSVDELTKSQASRIIDKIILEHGRIL